MEHIIGEEHCYEEKLYNEILEAFKNRGNHSNFPYYEIIKIMKKKPDEFFPNQDKIITNALILINTLLVLKPSNSP